MPACADPSLPLAPPPTPLPPSLRADLAYRRARGDSWEELGTAFRYDPDALRRAVHADPAFAAEQEAATAEAVWEAEAAAMHRLRRLTASEDPKVALRAAVALTRCVAVRHRVDAQRAKAAAKRVAVAKVEAPPESPRARPNEPARRAEENRPPRQVVMG